MKFFNKLCHVLNSWSSAMAIVVFSPHLWLNLSFISLCSHKHLFSSRLPCFPAGLWSDQAQSNEVNRPSCLELTRWWMWLWVHYSNERGAQCNNQRRRNLLQHEGCLSRIKHSSASAESRKKEQKREKVNFWNFAFFLKCLEFVEGRWLALDVRLTHSKRLFVHQRCFVLASSTQQTEQSSN